METYHCKELTIQGACKNRAQFNNKCLTHRIRQHRLQTLLEDMRIVMHLAARDVQKKD